MKSTDIAELIQLQSAAVASSTLAPDAIHSGAIDEPGVVTMGDVDGDGDGDLLVTLSKRDFRMVSGRDGRELWRISDPSWSAIWAVSSLNGDAGRDLIVFAVSDPIVESIPTGFRQTVEQKVGAISGTGRRLWTRTITGTNDVTGLGQRDPATGRWTGAYDQLVTDFIIPAVVDEATSEPSVFLDRLSWRLSGFRIADGGTDVFKAREVAQLLDARDGVDGVSIETEGVDWLPWTIPLTDLDSDGKSDLLVTELAEKPLGERTGVYAFQGLAAYSGANGSELWSQSYVKEWLVPASILGEDEEGFSEDYTFPLAITNRNGTNDILVVNYKTVPPWLHLMDGETGELKWRRSFTRQDRWVWTYLPGDIEGNGGDDIINVHEKAACPTPLGGDCELLDFEISAISGDDGSSLWTRSVKEADLAGLSTVLGNFDGDGVGDILFLIDTTGSIDDGVGPFWFSALSGGRGDVLWRSDREVDIGELPMPSGGDLNEDGVEELASVEFRESQYGGQVRKTVVYSGRDVAELWAVRDEVSHEVPASPGMAVEVVTSSSGPELVQPTWPGIPYHPPDILVYSSAGELLWRS